MVPVVVYLGLTLASAWLVVGGFLLTVSRYSKRLAGLFFWYTAATISTLVWLGSTIGMYLARDPRQAGMAERLATMASGLTALFFLFLLLAPQPKGLFWIRLLFPLALGYHMGVQGYVLSQPWHPRILTLGTYTWHTVQWANPPWLALSWAVMVLGPFLAALILYIRTYGQAIQYRPWYLRWPVYFFLIMTITGEALNILDVGLFAYFEVLPPLSGPFYVLLTWGILRVQFEVTPDFSSEAILGRVREGVLVFDTFNRLVEWNRTAAQALNLTERDQNLPLERFLDSHPYLNILRQRNARFPQEITWEANGETRVWEVDRIVLTDRRGAPLGWMAVFYDLTEHHRKDALLQFRTQSEILYRYLMALGLQERPLVQVLEQGAAWIAQVLGPYGLEALVLYQAETNTWRPLLAVGPKHHEAPPTLPWPPDALQKPQTYAAGRVFPVTWRERVFGALWARWAPQPFALEETLVQAASLLGNVAGLKEEEADLRRLYQVYTTINDAVLLLDEDFRVRQANPAASLLSGFAERELENLPFSRLFEESEATLAALKEQVATRGFWQGYLTLRRKDRETRLLDAYITPLRQADGRVWFTLVARDITERELLQRELVQQRALLEHLLHIARQALAAPLDVASMFEATARAAQERTGAEHIALVLLSDEGRLERFWISGDLPEGLSLNTIRAWLEEGLEPKGVLQRVFQRQRPIYLSDIRRVPAWKTQAQRFPWRSLLVLPLCREGRPYGILLVGHRRAQAFMPGDRAVLQGLAEILSLSLQHVRLYEMQTHLAQERLRARETEARLRQQQERLLANISHEMRTPLQAILGYLEWIRLQDPFTRLQDVQEELQEIERAGRHLLELVNQVLDFQKARTQITLLIQPFRVQAMLQDLLPLVHPLMTYNQNRFTVSVEPEDLEMESDPHKIMHILLNLLSNAAKFTHQGEVHLRIRAETRDGQEWVRMDVQDTGIGIPEDALNRIFEPFAQADESIAYQYGGTGLGLALAQQYARWLGGDITVQSQVGKGSTFTVYLPRRLKQTRALPQAS